MRDSIYKFSNITFALIYKRTIIIIWNLQLCSYRHFYDIVLQFDPHMMQIASPACFKCLLLYMPQTVYVCNKRRVLQFSTLMEGSLLSYYVKLLLAPVS